MNERFARAAVVARVELAHEEEFRLGGMLVRPALREVCGTGWSEILEPRVMQVLVVLARAESRVVSRDDLTEACWEGRIVGEDALQRCIARLRRLAEISGAFTLDTVPRVGYRLLASGNDASKPAATPGASEFGTAAANATIEEAPPRFIAIRTIAMIVIAILALTAIGVGVWYFRPRPVERNPAPFLNTVAVLPFTNATGDTSNDYFCEGFSEDLLNELSGNPLLRVTARTSSFALKARNSGVKDIARVLGVQAVVDGTILEIGNRVRINVELINSSDGSTLWSSNYNRHLSDIISVQDEIAHAIARVLTHRPAPPRPHKKIDPAVYRLYLKARQVYDDNINSDGRPKSATLLQQVIAKQPDFAPAFALLARTMLAEETSDPVHTRYYEVAASEAAEKALALDPHNIVARTTHALLELEVQNWKTAAAEYRQLRKENPYNVTVLRSLRIYYRTMGFPDEDIAAIRQALVLDPLSHFVKSMLWEELLNYDRYSELIAFARSPNLQDDDFLGPLCVSYSATGRIAEARKIAQRLRHQPPEVGNEPPSNLDSCNFSIAIATNDLVAGTKIVKGWARDYPDTFYSATLIGWAYVRLNDFNQADDWFERAYDTHDSSFYDYVYWKNGAEYRRSSRWKALTRRPGFLEWQAEHDRIATELRARGGAP